MSTRNDNGQELAIPITVEDRCMKEYHWSSDFAIKSIKGYRQFMKLKLQFIQLEDWHSTELSPSLTVRRVWNQHVLNFEHYINACNDYFGRVIGNNPDEVLENSEALTERIKNTKIALGALFGRDIDVDIWDFDDDGHHNESIGNVFNNNKRRRLNLEENRDVAIKQEEDEQKINADDDNNNHQSNFSSMKGTLSYNLDLRRHVIRGMWNYENSNNRFRPQRFELLRNLDKEEDPKELPKDGEFHGSFTVAYHLTTSKGKRKLHSKAIPEHGVNLVFTKVEDRQHTYIYKVDGKGTNQFGVFHYNGTATPSQHEGHPVYDIVLRKRYEQVTQPLGGGANGGGGGAGKATKKKTIGTADKKKPSKLGDPQEGHHSEKGVVAIASVPTRGEAESEKMLLTAVSKGVQAHPALQSEEGQGGSDGGEKGYDPSIIENLRGDELADYLIDYCERQVADFPLQLVGGQVFAQVGRGESTKFAARFVKTTEPIKEGFVRVHIFEEGPNTFRDLPKAAITEIGRRKVKS